MDRTDTPKTWICPVSGAHFECEVDEAKGEIRLNKFGQPMVSWTVTQADGGTGG